MGSPGKAVLIVAVAAAMSGCGGAPHNTAIRQDEAVSELRYAARLEERSKPAGCPSGLLLLQADKIEGCVTPAHAQRFRHFAAACASARSKIADAIERYSGGSGGQLPTAAQERSKFETLGREAERAITATIDDLRSSGAGNAELHILTERRAGLAAFVREVHRAKGLLLLSGWLRLFAERATPCGTPKPRG